MSLFNINFVDGQNLGKRISQQFSVNTNKIKKELDVINSLDFCDHLDFTTVSSPTSPVFLELEVSGISVEQQKAAHAFSLKTHALEEISVCRSEMHCMQEFLMKQRNDLLNEITSYGSPTRYTTGKNHYVSNQLFKIEQLWQKCQNLFQAEEVDTRNFVMDIHMILKKHLVSLFDTSQTLLPVTDEEISEILEEISELENQENGQVSDEDEEEFYEEIVEDAENL